jgi:hypothetical protein
LRSINDANLEVNAKKTKYFLLSPRQNAGENHDKKIADTSFENVVQFQ